MWLPSACSGCRANREDRSQMKFALTADQQLFAETAAQLLADHCPPSRVRDAWEGRTDSVLWNQLADMGVLGLLAREESGGLAMTDLDLFPLLVEAGRCAMVDPIVDSAAVAVPLLDMAGHEALASVINGERTVAVGFADDPFVRIDADSLLLEHATEAGAEWHLVDTSAVEATRETSVDGARRLATISWTPAASTLVTDAPGVSAAAFDRGIVGLSSQLLGLARHLLDETVGYTQQREQFGKPIGTFQALKHKLADVRMAIDFAEPVIARAAYSLAVGDPEAAVHAAMAKCYASDAATLAARHALQCHGAIAYTIEHDLHMWMKRIWALAPQWGDAAFHRRRVSGSLGLTPDASASA